MTSQLILFGINALVYGYLLIRRYGAVKARGYITENDLRIGAAVSVIFAFFVVALTNRLMGGGPNTPLTLWSGLNYLFVAILMYGMDRRR